MISPNRLPADAAHDLDMIEVVRGPRLDGKRLTVAAATLDVWWIDLDLWPATSASLSEAERSRADRLRVPLVRERFIAAHHALRTILALYTGRDAGDLSFDVNANGKPALSKPALSKTEEIAFSLSHSEDRAVVLVGSGGPVGVDCETILTQGRDIRPAVDLAMSEHERKLIEASPEDHRRVLLYRLWTRKEAVVKALGVGPGFPLHTVTVIGSPSPFMPVEIPGYPRLFVMDLDAPNRLAAAACAATRIRRIRRFDAPGSIRT